MVCSCVHRSTLFGRLARTCRVPLLAPEQRRRRSSREYRKAGGEKDKIMAEISSRISVKPVIAVTDYTWSLHGWSLLFPYYNDIKSPKISMKDLAECTCQMNLVIEPLSYCYEYRAKRSACYLQMEFKNIPYLLSIRIVTSLRNKEGSILWAAKSENRSNSMIRQKFPKTFTADETEYVKNDTLIIHVNFVIVKSVTITSSLSENVYGDLLEETFQANLKALHDLKKSHDVTFIMGEDKLFAHKLVLADKSEVFKAMFMAGEKETDRMRRVDIKSRKETVEKFLDYMYDEKVHGLDAVIDELIILAYEYKVDGLKTVCENYMLLNLNAENVIQYLLIAYELHCEELIRQALRFIKLNGRKSPILDDHRLLVKYLDLAKIDFNE